MKERCLMIHEIRKMCHDPVWIEEIVSGRSYWAIITDITDKGIYLLDENRPDDYASFVIYGKTWEAYRNKQEI